jgi:hypothetical protein
MRQFIDYKGNKFYSLVEFCKQYDVARNDIYYWENKGKDLLWISEYLDKKRLKRLTKEQERLKRQELKLLNEKILSYHKVINFKNKSFNSIKELCDYYELKYDTFMKRQNRGWTLEECILGRKTKQKPKIMDKTKRKSGIEYEGKFYKSQKDLCDTYGISFNTFRSRYHRGLTLDECLKTK